MKRAMLLLPLFLCACKTQIPTCSDKATYSIVRSIIHEQVDKLQKRFKRTQSDEAVLTALTALDDNELADALPIRNAHATAFDQGIKQFSCSATIDVALEVDEKTTNLEVPITYDSQLDDNNQHLVNLRNFTEENLQIYMVALTQEAQKGIAKMAPAAAKTSAHHPILNSPAATSDFAAMDGTSDPLTTRYGTLAIDGDLALRWNGDPVNPSVKGNSALWFLQKYEVGSSDVVLIMDIGGTACPALFYFVTVSANGVTATPEFGSCSDLIKSVRNGDTLYISMPSNEGANNPQVYSLTNGVLAENGKAVLK